MSMDPDNLAPRTPEGDDALAAEYVLGVLDLAERMAFEARLRAEPVLRHRVERWEARLAPLNDEFADVPAPDLLPAIEARLFGPRPSRLRFWGGWLGGALAAGLAIAVGLTQLPPPPGPAAAPGLRATLSAEAQTLVFAAAYDPATGQLRVARTAGPAAEAGRDYQLWLIGASGVPVPLGLLREAEVVTDVAALIPGETLAVSLEPAGGSPTGAPTGPVLVTGLILDL